MQIIKPRQLSVISQTYRYRKTQLAVGTLGFFRFGSADYLSEQEGWRALAPLLSRGLVLDTGHAKPRAEFLLVGSACAPQGQTVSRMQVTVQVGSVKKTLQVVGDRHWLGRPLRAPSAAQPFAKMPLSFARAYGGAQFAHNPLGKGYGAEEGFWHLPNIYAERESIKANHRPRQPTAFEPLDVRWPQRQQYSGNYDQAWLQQGQPGFADDTQPAFFNAAMADQQLDGFIEPGTQVELLGLHPERQRWQFCLPELKARMFIRQTTAADAKLVEATGQIDTLWLFPEFEMGLVIHRAVFAVQDSLGLDVAQLLLAYERSHDEPRPLDHYQQALNERTDAATAAVKMLHEAPLKPQKSPQQQAQEQQLYRQAEQRQQQTRQAFIEQLAEQVKTPPQSPTAVNKPSAESSAEPSAEPPTLPPELIRRGDVDLTPHVAFAEQQTEQARQASEQQRHAAMQHQPFNTPESLSEIHTRVMTVRALEHNSDEALASLPSPLRQQLQADPEALARWQQAAQLQHGGQFQARIQSPVCMTLSRPLPLGGAQQIRNLVIELLQRGVSLAGRDLAGGDLRGIDFRHCDLRQTGLERCQLQGCCFDDAQLSQAVLTEANLEQASFRRADLSQANLSATSGEQVDFSAAQLHDTLLHQAQLPHAQFHQAHLLKTQALQAHLPHAQFVQANLEQVLFLQADLAHSQWRDCALTLCNFTKASLQSADWQQTRLLRCVMVGLNAQAVQFHHIEGEKVQFSNEGQLNSTRMTHCSWHTCGFRGVDLQQAQLSHSLFQQCDFGDGQLQASQLTRCAWLGCILLQANLTAAQVDGCLFHQSQLGKLKTQRSRFTQTRIEQCHLLELALDDEQRRHVLISPIANVG